MAKGFRDILGIPASTASTTNSALIIIDAQNEYAQGLLTTVDVASTRGAIASLLEKYRKGGKAENIVHVVHKTPDGAPVFTPGTELAEEFKELTPMSGEKIVGKQFPSCFAKTDLHEYLNGIGVNKIVLVGYMAHVCVSTTAKAGSELGYDVLLAADGIGDRDFPGASGKHVTEMVLLELGDAFGTVVQSANIK